MNTQCIDLAFILKQFPNFKFSMNDYVGRMRLQRFVYILQLFDIYLGYNYSWKLNGGPFDSNLQAVGFALDTIYNKIPDREYMRFHQDEKQENFERFSKFIKDKNDEFLEIASMIHFYTILGLDIDIDKEPYQKIYKELKRYNII